jgi:hypothetical protein
MKMIMDSAVQKIKSPIREKSIPVHQ